MTAWKYFSDTLVADAQITTYSVSCLNASVNETTLAHSISIYPNPTNGQFVIANREERSGKQSPSNFSVGLLRHPAKRGIPRNDVLYQLISFTLSTKNHEEGLVVLAMEKKIPNFTELKAVFTSVVRFTYTLFQPLVGLSVNETL